MTAYEYGFLVKCAECGIDPQFAGHMLKLAQQTAGAPAANPQQPAASVPAGPKSNAGQWAPPQGISAKHQGYYDRWSKMDTQSQYKMLQRATPEQRQLLRSWSSPEQVKALTGYHKQQLQSKRQEQLKQRAQDQANLDRENASFNNGATYTNRNGAQFANQRGIDATASTLQGAGLNANTSRRLATDAVMSQNLSLYGDGNQMTRNGIVTYRSPGGGYVSIPQSAGYTREDAQRNASTATGPVTTGDVARMNREHRVPMMTAEQVNHMDRLNQLANSIRIRRTY